MRYFRIIFAAIIFVLLFVLFVDFTETIPNQFHALAHVQIVPAFTGIIISVLVFWFFFTLLFGRFYCSAVCPLGILQDVLIRLTKQIKGKKYRLRYAAPMMKTRYAVLLVFLAGCAAFPVAVSLLDPYSNFGRIMTWLVKPVVVFGNNFLAGMLPDQFHFVSDFISLPAFGAALVIFLIVAVLSFLWGRRYCNSVCPVGTLLGILSKRSLFRVRLNKNCKACGMCEKNCKSECIDVKNKTVDASRCVDCFNCLSICKFNGIGYGIKTGAANPESLPAVSLAKETRFSRRSVLAWSLFSSFIPSVLRGEEKPEAAATGAAELPQGRSRVSYELTAPVLPPGTKHRNHFRKHCTACHLCVAKCPSKVLTPAKTELGLAGFLQPVAKYKNGFCNFDCTICVEVCPCRALSGISSTEEKHLNQMGQAVFLKENCVVHTQEVNCGACAEHCPTGAISMRPYGKPELMLLLPVVDEELCIGCGACEFICPVAPYRAIYVDGLVRQGKAKPANDPNQKQEEIKLDNFGF